MITAILIILGSEGEACTIYFVLSCRSVSFGQSQNGAVADTPHYKLGELQMPFAPLLLSTSCSDFVPLTCTINFLSTFRLCIFAYSYAACIVGLVCMRLSPMVHHKYQPKQDIARETNKPIERGLLGAMDSVHFEWSFRTSHQLVDCPAFVPFTSPIISSPLNISHPLFARLGMLPLL